jgi:hypothetical protein
MDERTLTPKSSLEALASDLMEVFGAVIQGGGIDLAPYGIAAE